MTLNPAARRREHDFARGLESSARPTGAVGSLRTLAVGLEAPELGPRPEFRDALRQRLVAVATVAPHQSTAPAPVRAAVSWRTQRRMAAATGGLAAVVAVSGVAVAGERSLPGEAFYGVKRAGEQVQLWAARGDVARGEAHLSVAATRLDEASALTRGTRLSATGAGPSAAGADAALVTSSLADMDEHFRAGSTLLVQAWRADHDDRTLSRLQAFSGRAHDQLAALMPSLPSQARPQAAASLALLGTVGTRTDALLRGTCDAGCTSVEGAPCDCGTTAPSPEAVTPTAPSSPVAPAPTSPRPGAPAPSAPVEPGAPAEPAAPTGPSQQDSDEVADLLDLLVPASPSGRPAVVVPPTLPTSAPVPLPGVPSTPLVP